MDGWMKSATPHRGWGTRTYREGMLTASVGRLNTHTHTHTHRAFVWNLTMSIWLLNIWANQCYLINFSRISGCVRTLSGSILNRVSPALGFAKALDKHRAFRPASPPVLGRASTGVEDWNAWMWSQYNTQGVKCTHGLEKRQNQFICVYDHQSGICLGSVAMSDFCGLSMDHLHQPNLSWTLPASGAVDPVFCTPSAV